MDILANRTDRDIQITAPVRGDSRIRTIEARGTLEIDKLSITPEIQALIDAGDVFLGQAAKYHRPATTIAVTDDNLELANGPRRPIYQAPVGKTVVVDRLDIRCTSAGLVTIPAAVSVGSTPGGDDIAPLQTLTGFGTPGQVYRLALQNPTVEASGIYLNVEVQSDATLEVEVYVSGYII